MRKRAALKCATKKHCAQDKALRLIELVTMQCEVLEDPEVHLGAHTEAFANRGPDKYIPGYREQCSRVQRQSWWGLTSAEAQAASRNMGLCSASSFPKLVSSPYHHMSSPINGSDSTLL